MASGGQTLSRGSRPRQGAHAQPGTETAQAGTMDGLRLFSDAWFSLGPETTARLWEGT